MDFTEKIFLVWVNWQLVVRGMSLLLKSFFFYLDTYNSAQYPPFMYYCQRKLAFTAWLMGTFQTYSLALG